MEDPPSDPDAWTDEQWQQYLQATADDGPAADELLDRPRRPTPGGSVLGAAMLGLEQALYGERPKEEVVVEADSDDPNRDRSLYDPDDPGGATLSLVVDPAEPADPGRAERDGS